MHFISQDFDYPVNGFVVEVDILGMVNVTRLGILLEPTERDFENLAVLNPACFQEGDLVHMFYRAVDKDYRSCIGYALLKGPTTVIERWERPIISREHDYESKGVEDPRITKINDTFYLTYVAHDGKNAVTAYATSTDLKTFQKGGLISPRITYDEALNILRESPLLKDAYAYFASFYKEEGGDDILLWHKDLILFPKKIEGKFAMLHRVLPDIQIVFFKDFQSLTAEFWRKHLRQLSNYVILENKHWFESRSIGGGCVPLETPDGWLAIFHTVEARNIGRVYHASAALLDLKNPMKVLERLHEPLFSPTTEWEKLGMVPNVVFPTGTALFGDTLYVYYGAADTRIAVAAVSVSELIAELKDPTKAHGYAQ